MTCNKARHWQVPNDPSGSGKQSSFQIPSVFHQSPQGKHSSTVSGYSFEMQQESKERAKCEWLVQKWKKENKKEPKTLRFPLSGNKMSRFCIQNKVPHRKHLGSDKHVKKIDKHIKKTTKYWKK